MTTVTSTMKNALIGIIAGVLVILAIWALLPGSDTDENVVVVYSPHGKDLLNDFKARFEAAHPGIIVRLLPLPGQDVKARIRAEGRNPKADVWWGGGITDFVQLEREGLLEPYRPSWADQIDPQFRSPGDSFYAQWMTPEVIMYNSQALTADEAPGDWDDLVKDKWKDKIVIRYPLKSSTMKTIYSAMIYRFYKKDQNPDRGYAWLLDLDRNTTHYAADPTDMHQRLAAQKGVISLWNMPDAILYHQKHGLPIAYKIPASGTPVLADCIAIVKGAPHLANAKTFYEFVTSLESLIVQAGEPYGRIPAREDVPKSKLPQWIAKLDLSAIAMEIDWELFVREQENWMRYWDANIKGKGR